MMCSSCAKSLPRIKGTVCIKCGREKDVCTCKGAEMYYESIAAPFYFEGNVRKGVHAFKFRKNPANADAYSYEMSGTIKQMFQNIIFDYITEVPMTKKSVKKRGYYQCSRLAERISKQCSIEYVPGLIIKLYETDTQHNLSYYLRKGNLTGDFDVPEPNLIKDKTILICDDISTSGETLNECAKMLWLYGAKEVYCISIALTKGIKYKKERR